MEMGQQLPGGGRKGLGELLGGGTQPCLQAGSSQAAARCWALRCSELWRLWGERQGFEPGLYPTTPARSQPAGWLQNKRGTMGESGCLWDPTWEKAPPHIRHRRIRRGEHPKTTTAMGTAPTGTHSTPVPWELGVLARTKWGGFLYLLLGWDAPSLAANARPGGCRIPTSFRMSFVTAAPRTGTCLPRPHWHL